MAGVELAIEAKDIVRDPATWDGYVEVHARPSTVGDEDASTDTVKLRVAPVLTFHHLLPAEEVFGQRHRRPPAIARRAPTSRSTAAAAGVPAPTLIDEQDPWAQDFFETGVHVDARRRTARSTSCASNYRSANVYAPERRQEPAPARRSGRLHDVPRQGHGRASSSSTSKHSPDMDSLNSFGNIETIPPYELGGKSLPVRAHPPRQDRSRSIPTRRFAKMIEAQGQQPPIYVDTSWLLVGHVDETMSFVKAKSARGWALLVNDADLAKKMLEDAGRRGQRRDADVRRQELVRRQRQAVAGGDRRSPQVLADTARDDRERGRRRGGRRSAREGEGRDRAHRRRDHPRSRSSTRRCRAVRTPTFPAW